jgi:mono/diheme cytochrome c family protein
VDTWRSRLVAVALLATCGLHAQTITPRTTRHGDAEVTPVSGESWLTHLRRPFGDTSMGKTGRLGPAPVAGVDTEPPFSPVALHPVTETVTLRGSDLYRLNCQGCHGESGMGAPPEINSVINPVRATSVALVQERMKKTGMDISYGEAAKLAEESMAALLTRLRNGGEYMPAFPQLGDVEIRPLLAYLRQLADMPGARAEQSTVGESHLRVGEFIVKSTCHTCHGATGPNPGPQELLDGAIPPLSTLTTRKNESEFIRKVTEGAPVVMGTPSMLYRGRMPVFYYLSAEEAADVYLYLTMYPPSDVVLPSPLVAASLAGNRPPGPGSGPAKAVAVPIVKAAKETTPVDRTSQATAGLPWIVPFAVLLLTAGVVFTFREIKRLSAESGVRSSSDHTVVRPRKNLFETICRAPDPMFHGGSKKSAE